MRHVQRCGLALVSLMACGLVWSQGATPNDAEATALAALKGQIQGQIVWESNRDGSWQLYTMNADGTGAKKLTEGPGAHSQAKLSRDGKLLVCTRTEPNGATSVWMMKSDGTDPKKVIDDALEPQWRKGDKALHVLRQPDRRKKQWQTFELDLYSGEEKLLFPPPGVELEFEPWAAEANDDGTRFISWSPRPRGTWVISADGAVQQLVHGGCEGQVSPDQQYGYGVHSDGRFVRFNLSDGGDLATVKERWGEWSHTYFPHVSRDGKWLLYGACPPDQHDHDTSDYEIFVVGLKDWQEDGDPVRLTFNSRTDRWPSLYLSDQNALAGDAYDVAGNRAMNPPPPPRMVFSFGQENAKPDPGGESGLWPQQDGCRGDLTWIADDAEGGAGGSVKIEYTIEADPKSFSLWIAPGEMDLTPYDRVVIYARGTAPSLTMVVKDNNLGAPEDPDGIADCLVTGITGEWQRFELAFSDFVSRKPGAAVDWRTVNHFGICMIAPRNQEAGTIQVDNLRVEAGD